MDKIFQNCIKLVKNKSLSGIKLSKSVKKHVSSFEMRESIVTFCAPMKTERLFSLVSVVKYRVGHKDWPGHLELCCLPC